MLMSVWMAQQPVTRSALTLQEATLVAATLATLWARMALPVMVRRLTKIMQPSMVLLFNNFQTQMSAVQSSLIPVGRSV